jgi:hypothetical protein
VRSARTEWHNPSLALSAATCTTCPTYDGAGAAVTRSIHAGTPGWHAVVGEGPRGELGLEGAWLALRGVTRTHQRTRVR